MTPDWKSEGEVFIGEFIVTELTRRGSGKGWSPIRVIRQVWSKSGLLVAEWDPCLERENEGLLNNSKDK